MRIGIDARTLMRNRVGMGTYTHEVIKQLNDIDSENEYYLYSNRKIYVDFKLNKNWKICEHKGRMGTLWLYFKLPKILKEDNIDVFWGTQHCLPKRNRKTKHIKFIVTIHDLAIHKLKTVGEWKNTILMKIFLKKSCKNADKIIAVSNATKEDILQIFGISKEKIHVIYEAGDSVCEYNLNKENENEIEKKFNIMNKNYLFFLSTIEPRKNLNTAIKAFEIYKDENKDDLKFIISGGVGWKCQKTLEMIEKSKYKNDIIRTGYIAKEEKEYFFTNCKAVMYPSLYEGFGLPVLEAMQRGAIVITSNISSLPEVGGKAALYLDNVTDSVALAEIIKKVVNMNDKERENYINEGYIQVKKFSWKKCAFEILELFKQEC